MGIYAYMHVCICKCSCIHAYFEIKTYLLDSRYVHIYIYVLCVYNRMVPLYHMCEIDMYMYIYSYIYIYIKDMYTYVI